MWSEAFYIDPGHDCIASLLLNVRIISFHAIDCFEKDALCYQVTRINRDARELVTQIRISALFATYRTERLNLDAQAKS